MVGSSGGELEIMKTLRVQLIFQPMSVKKKPATPKSKAKPPTGPARIRYQVGLNLILLAITPDPQVHYNGAAQTLQVTSLQAEVGFTSKQWSDSSLCVPPESGQGGPAWRGTGQLCLHYAAAKHFQCKLLLRIPSKTTFVSRCRQATK